MKIHSLKFHNELLPKPLSNGKDWELSVWYAVTFYIDDDPQKYLVLIPKRYITDFGSIPRSAWPIVGSPATGRHRRGTVFHDWLFTMHTDRGVSFANALFDAIMTHDNTPYYKRILINLAVSTAGRISWMKWKDRKASYHYKYLHDRQFNKRFVRFSDCSVII